ncbi:MAG: hypothetical protein NVSMB47_07960 [Polyangiales bacterium]
MIGPLALAASVLLTLGDPGAQLLAPRETVFPFDDERRLLRGDHGAGKLWRSHRLPTDGAAVPLIVFVHGIVFDGRKHHWLTDDPSGPWDARPILERLVDDGVVAPLVAAVPSQTRDATDPTRLFLDFDFDAFVDAVDAQLAPEQRVDRRRVIVVGHSAAACDPRAAAFAALGAKRVRLRALFAIDGCLSVESAELLATTSGADQVVVAYETWAWERSFDAFVQAWNAARATSLAPGSHVLEVADFPSENLHLEIVGRTLEKWLPSLLPPAPPPALELPLSIAVLDGAF